MKRSLDSVRSVAVDCACADRLHRQRVESSCASEMGGSICECVAVTAFNVVQTNERKRSTTWRHRSFAITRPRQEIDNWRTSFGVDSIGSRRNPITSSSAQLPLLCLTADMLSIARRVAMHPDTRQVRRRRCLIAASSTIRKMSRWGEPTSTRPEKLASNSGLRKSTGRQRASQRPSRWHACIVARRVSSAFATAAA